MYMAGESQYHTHIKQGGSADCEGVEGAAIAQGQGGGSQAR